MWIFIFIDMVVDSIVSGEEIDYYMVSVVICGVI